MFKAKKKFSYKRLKGSSFSETLIVIAMLCIVFTLSLGTIVADYNKNQMVVRLQKIFSVIGQALRQAESVNGAPYTWDFPVELTPTNTHIFFEQYIKPYLILTLDCKTSNRGNCDFDFKELNGNKKTLNLSWTRFYLNDGAFIAMQIISNSNNKVIYFYVDINGKKRLNVVGRDIFMFEYWLENELHPDWEGILLPFGHQYNRDELISNRNENNCNSERNGNYCSSVIWQDGWQMKQGYPWAQARYIVK